MKKNQKKKPIKKQEQIQKIVDSYKVHKVGVIKDIKFGLLPGTMLGAFATIHDGGFGAFLTIVDVEHSIPFGYSMGFEECESFFKYADVIWHNQLKGKHVLILHNREPDLMMYAEKIVPYINLIKSLDKSDKE